MVARMPRYAPASSGIRNESRILASGQNGSSRHVLALFDSSSRIINEQSSGLLISGLGVQVPGGAPALTWGFTAPGHFLCVRFVPVVAPWLLARTDPAIRACQKRPIRRPMRGIRPGTARSRMASAAPSSLDQWSRPSSRTPGAHPESLYRCRHAARDPLVIGTRAMTSRWCRRPGTPVICHGCEGQRRGVPGRRRRQCVSARSGESAGHSVCRRCPERRGARASCLPAGHAN